jgi:pyridoxine kinase
LGNFALYFVVFFCYNKENRFGRVFSMDYKRVLTIQDISCVGQCSLGVAMPILSACGVETCVLPSAVLSTHTAFPGAVIRDLTEDMPRFAAHWQQAGIRFDAIASGYLGSQKQIEYVSHIFDTLGKDSCVKIVDPAMADHGKLYRGFDGAFVEAMGALCRKADYLMPNMTEACLLTGTPFREEYDRAFVEELLHKLSLLGPKNIILTGAAYTPGITGVAVLEQGQIDCYGHEKLPSNRHGTGDIFAAAFTGALMRGTSAREAAKIAADFVCACIQNSIDDQQHWYGTKFEPMLPKLIESLA